MGSRWFNVGKVANNNTGGTLAKPTWRGKTHILAAILALPAVAALYHHVEPTAKSAVTLYGTTLVLLFAISGTYHVPIHPPLREKIIRGIDHSMIYVFIAGSYTPFIHALQGGDGAWLTPAIWLGAIGGALKSGLWPTAPRVVNTAIYVLLGWIAVPVLPEFYKSFSTLTFSLLVCGGFIFTMGGVIYARQKPDPWPTYFGYHEIFHVCIIIGAACHYVAIWDLLVPPS